MLNQAGYFLVLDCGVKHNRPCDQQRATGLAKQQDKREKQLVMPSLSGSHGHAAIKVFSTRVEILVIMLAHSILVFHLFTSRCTLGNSTLEKRPEGWMMDACCNIKAQSSADGVKTEMARL